MLELIIAGVSILVSVLITVLLEISWWYLLLIFIACWIVIFILFILFCGIIACISNVNEKPKRFFMVTAYMICCFLQRFFRIKVIKEGFEQVKDDKFMLVSNHQSNNDPLLLISLFKDKNLIFIMKQSILNIPIVGKWLKVSGFLALDRENNRKALETILNSVKRVNNGYSVGVFPEGTRSKGPEMGTFRDGAFKIALKSKIPIVVCILDNEYKLSKRFPFRRTKVLVKVVRVLSYEEIKEMNTAEISTVINQEMVNALANARCKYDWLK